MNLVDQKIVPLKGNVVQMMNMVLSQVQKCHKSLLNFDKDLAEDIISREKKINSMDLKIDDECEKVLALNNPVATDLRFVLSSLKINTFLERIGDNAEAIARISNNLTEQISKKDIVDFRVIELFVLVEEMIDVAIESFDNGDTTTAIRIFKLDRKVDEINDAANELTLSRIKENNVDAKHYLDLLSIIRKVERIGDLTKNIAEETVFYLEAKVFR